MNQLTKLVCTKKYRTGLYILFCLSVSFSKVLFALDKNVLTSITIVNSPELKTLPSIKNVLYLSLKNTGITSIDPIEHIGDLNIKNTHINLNEINLSKISGIVKIDDEQFDRPATIGAVRYNIRGFDITRLHKNGTFYDDNGYDYDGYNAKGFNLNGTNRNGTLYDADGHSAFAIAPTISNLEPTPDNLLSANAPTSTVASSQTPQNIPDFSLTLEDLLSDNMPTGAFGQPLQLIKDMISTTEEFHNIVGRFVVRKIAIKENTVLLATNIGLLRLERPDVRGIRHYHKIGGLPSNDVTDVAIFDGTIYVVVKGFLWISTDGGNSFQSKPLPDYDFHGIYISDGIIYMAGSNGLFISNDGGNNFKKKDIPLPEGEYVISFCVSGGTTYLATYKGLFAYTEGGDSFTIAYKKLGGDVANSVCVSGDTIYATTYKGLFISTDGGNSFTIAYNEYDNPVNSVYVSDGTIYATTMKGLLISTDGGKSFKKKIIDQNIPTDNPGGSIDGIYVSGSTIYAATIGGLFISTDGGESFRNEMIPIKEFDKFNIYGSDLVRDVYVSDGIIYAATKGGLFTSTDGGNSFTVAHHEFYDSLTDVRSVYVSNGIVYAATGDALFISTDRGRSFRKMIINQLQSDIFGNSIYNIHASENTICAATHVGLLISTDGGKNFQLKTTVNGLGDNHINSVYVSDGTIYAATRKGLFISTDKGNSFRNPIGYGNNHREDEIISIYVASNGTIYAGVGVIGGGLLISNDRGNSFQFKTTVSRVNKVYVSDGTIYAATYGGLSTSTDGGSTFQNKTIGEGLGDDWVNSVYVSDGTIYAATNQGLSTGYKH
ncbi:MAG: hypothetical protein HQK53_07065 [Oligoflexia bacterium]|nr:hypothetical protein [Oligoflexia bacterium]